MSSQLVERLERIEAELARHTQQLAADVRALNRVNTSIDAIELQLAAINRLHSPTHHQEGLLDELRPLLEGLRSDVQEIIRRDQRDTAPVEAALPPEAGKEECMTDEHQRIDPDPEPKPTGDDNGGGGEPAPDPAPAE